MHPGPHHFVSHHPFILFSLHFIICLLPPSLHPQLQRVLGLNLWKQGTGSPITPSSHLSSFFIIFYPFILSPFIWFLIILSPHHPFILSPFILSAFIFSPTIISLSYPPIAFILFPNIPSYYFRIPTHLIFIIILHNYYLFILFIVFIVAPSFCLGSYYLILNSCPLSIISFPLISHFFHFIPYHFDLINIFFNHMLNMVGNSFLILFLLEYIIGLIF